MEDEFNEESRGKYEQLFTKLEIQVVDISCNMSILMVDIEIKFISFGNFEGSNFDFGSEGNL